MSATSLDFSFNMEGLYRNALLTEAAERLNVLCGHLGDDAQKAGDSPLAALVKELQGDVAEFAKSPVVQKITEERFASSTLQIGDRFKELTKNYNLYCVDFPVYLHAKRGWGLDKLEAIVEFNPENSEPMTRPKAIRILPDKQFQTQMQAGTRLEFGLDENLAGGSATQRMVSRAACLRMEGLSTPAGTSQVDAKERFFDAVPEKKERPLSLLGTAAFSGQ